MIRVLFIVNLFLVACTSFAPIPEPPAGLNFNSGSQQVWRENDLIWENYVGKRSHEYNANLDFNSQFRICSNTKLFTAVSILQLVEAGKIASIHDDIKDYLDDDDLLAFGLKTWCPVIINTTECQNITFVSLMAMSSGLVSGNACPYAPEAWEYKYCWDSDLNLIYPGSIAATIRIFINVPLASVPGPRYSLNNATSNFLYTNENFILLSYFIEKLSGLSLDAYYQRYIFDVVGLGSAVYDPYSQAFKTIPNPVTEYYYYTDYTVSNQPFALGTCASTEVNPGLQAGAGGIVMNVPDMVKWYSSLFLKQNTTVLTKSSIKLLSYPWAYEGALKPIPQYYGLGLEMSFIVPPPELPSGFPQPAGIFYYGSSDCTFFSIAIWYSTINPFNSSQTLNTNPPLVSTAVANNRLLNVSRATWQTTRSQRAGTFMQSTADWSFLDFEITLLLALNTLFYFAAM